MYSWFFWKLQTKMQQENIHLGGDLLTQLKGSGAATGI
jgi:hypothetical protein